MTRDRYIPFNYARALNVKKQRGWDARTIDDDHKRVVRGQVLAVVLTSVIWACVYAVGLYLSR